MSKSRLEQLNELIRNYERSLSEYNHLADEINNLRELDKRDLHQTVQAIVPDKRWVERGYYDYAYSSKVTVRLKKMLEFYEAEEVFARKQLEIAKKRINDFKL